MRALILSALALLLAGCEGGHHDSAGPDPSPLIRHLVITPLTPLVEGHTGVYQFEAEFFDPDGDLAGGSCAIDTSIGFAEIPLAVASGTDPHATTGTVLCLFETTVLGRVVSGTFSLADRHGHRSNAIGFSIPAERPTAAASAPDTTPRLVGLSARLYRNAR